MEIAVLRHERFEGLGVFEDALARRSVSFFYHDAGDEIPGENYHAAIVMGGSMSANDALPGLALELQWIERALRQGTPMLGICLGSQLIAKTLGARVYRNQELEIGWEPVFFTDAGLSDPMFRSMKSPTTFFHWHGETFDLPGGAEWLAYSKTTRHQAYRYGRNVYGLQFHPEVTPAMILDWQEQPVNCGDVATLEAPIDAGAYDQRPMAYQIIDAWLESARIPARAS
ncbi:MAG TPA: type 1 glutamine amidotransferase [Bryobacteraceae bacterium]|nr:type 1 glutamine amidotransferase [Bryobacteraceae bacterium]